LKVPNTSVKDKPEGLIQGAQGTALGKGKQKKQSSEGAKQKIGWLQFICSQGKI